MKKTEKSDEPIYLSTGATVRRLWPYFWPATEPQLRQYFVLSCVLMIAARLLSLIVPLFFKGAVDQMRDVSPVMPYIVVPVGLILGFGLTRILVTTLNEVKDHLFSKVEYHAIYQLGIQVFQSLHKLSLRFHLDRKTGKLSRVIERGTLGIDRSLRFLMFTILPTFLESFFVVGIFLILYPSVFAVITSVTLVLYVWVTFAITNWRNQYLHRMNAADDDSNTKAVDSLLNYETVKYYGNEEMEYQRFGQAIKKFGDEAVRFKATLGYLNIAQAFIIAISVTMLLWITAVHIEEGLLTLGDFVMINIYLMQIYLPLGNLGFAFREIKQSLVNIAAMVQLLDEVPDIIDAPSAQALPRGPGSLIFDHVSFAYTPDRPILKDVSFEVPPGKTLAIVGPSGSGKSTIARLLCRFYDVQQGSILINGYAITMVTQDSLRKAVGVVPQDTVLFNDTLGYNIQYGQPSASWDEVTKAAHMAELDAFIMRLPQGYETMVGERGLKLSGGEKQRVAIARTILKNPEIFIFDEATSALDTHTEKEIQRNLLAISQGRTTVMIAHRLSTIVHADEIIVLVHGAIAERGSHESLLAQPGSIYGAMWRQQQKDETEVA